MNDRLDKLRLAFPAEVTAAFLAAQKILNDPHNFDFQMMGFLVALLVVNVLIYYFFYKIKSPLHLIYVSVGFYLWAVSIDSERLKDLLPFHYYPTFPLLLVLYTLISAYIPLPKTDVARGQDRHPDTSVKK